MEEEIKKLIIEIINDLNYDLSDLELQKYLYEKGAKAFNKINSGNYSLDEIRTFLVSNVPIMMKEYERLKQSIAKKSLAETNFGVSINYQLVELFKILNSTLSSDEFITMKTEYLKSQPVIFPGILECTHDEIKNIYNNIIENCDVITPEAEAKMTAIINNQMDPFNNDGSVNTHILNFFYLDSIVNFAKQHDMKVRLHTLVWHKHFPKILENYSKNQIVSFLDFYFSSIANRYSNDTFYSIDVLNEIVADINSEEFKRGENLRNSKWKEKLGNDYYLTILKLARKNFPNSNFTYNEYDETNSEKRKRMIKIIDEIKQEETITG
ncbi:MAG: endo-1,4-beta-xylanase, partial [Bacilli bacterium]